MLVGGQQTALTPVSSFILLRNFKSANSLLASELLGSNKYVFQLNIRIFFLVFAESLCLSLIGLIFCWSSMIFRILDNLELGKI